MATKGNAVIWFLSFKKPEVPVQSLEEANSKKSFAIICQ